MNTARTRSSTSEVVKERGRPRGRLVVSVLVRIISLDSAAHRHFCTISHKNMEGAMELFASPMACSLASHITALEAGLPVKLRFVKDKKTDDGGDYYEISAKGYVPALRLDDGTILNEGASVLQYLADRKPEPGLTPDWGPIERYYLIDTPYYLGNEVPQQLFLPDFSPATPDAAKREAQAQREL